MSVGVLAMADNAGGLQWVSQLLPPADGKCQSNIHAVRTNAEGMAFVLGNYGSIAPDDETTFLGTTITGADYGTGSGYNINMVFAKVDSLGKPQWVIHSTEGYFAGGVFCPTNDGGAVLAVKFRLTEKNKQDGVKNPYIVLTDGAGKTYSLDDTYQGTNLMHIVLVRVDAQGAVTQFVPMWASHAVAPQSTDNKPTADVADITAIMEDEEGNLYWQGGQAMDIALGTDTIYARENADWDGSSFSSHCNSFVIKTTAQFGHIAHTTTAGNLQYDRFMLAAYHNGNIVLAGHAMADGTGNLRWGDQQLAVRDRCIVTAHLDRNLTCTAMYQVQQVRVNNMSGMFKHLAWSNDSATLYMSGSLNGGLLWKGDTIASGNKEAGKKNDGLLLQIDAATAEPTGVAVLHSDILNVNIGAASVGDTVYVLNYQFGTDISLLVYDDQLNYIGSRVLATGGGSLSALSMDRYNERLYIAMRAHGGAPFNIGNQTMSPKPLWYATLSGWLLKGDASTGTISPELTTEKAKKVVIDGRLYIRKGNQLFNALGQQL